ncbi:MAG: polysaccharide deacetylase family protein [Firmicutes bacterium]|nr:polysaccharide deacetylase family protein [Bacillota bacterium]
MPRIRSRHKLLGNKRDFERWNSMPDITYTIQAGDTLYLLARRYGTTVDAIVQANQGIDPMNLRVGQRINIPGPAGGTRYAIQPGDTLYGIGRRFGTTVGAIIQSNPGIDPMNLQVGQQITVPVRMPATAYFQGGSSKKLVALTFDATYGDNQTETLLGILRDEGITATWFLSGIWAEQFPTLTRAVESAGHEIGNHSMTHPHMTGLTAAQMASEITRAARAIESRVNRRVNLFRPPFGEYNQTLLGVAAELGYRTIMWTVDSLDWQEPPPAPQVIADRVLAAVKNGAIVLMHNAGRNTPAAVRLIIRGIRQRGLGFGTVTRVLDP